jgi:hypothetical protein
MEKNSKNEDESNENDRDNDIEEKSENENDKDDDDSDSIDLERVNDLMLSWADGRVTGERVQMAWKEIHGKRNEKMTESGKSVTTSAKRKKRGSQSSDMSLPPKQPKISQMNANLVLPTENAMIDTLYSSPLESAPFLPVQQQKD